MPAGQSQLFVNILPHFTNRPWYHTVLFFLDLLLYFVGIHTHTHTQAHSSHTFWGWELSSSSHPTLRTCDSPRFQLWIQKRVTGAVLRPQNLETRSKDTCFWNGRKLEKLVSNSRSYPPCRNLPRLLSIYERFSILVANSNSLPPS